MRLLRLLAAGITLGGCLQVLSHDEKLAGKSAQEFAVTAFVKRDFGKAYALTSKRFQGQYDSSNFKALMESMHPEGFPQGVKAYEFEPIPGQPAMSIILVGANPGHVYYYRLVMEGTAPAGYQVGGIFRGNGPYPPSKLRQKLDI